MNEVKKIPLISLDSMSLEESKGGVGLQDISKRNLAFGGKLIWHMYSKPDSKWCSLMRAKYLDSQNTTRIFTMLNPPEGSAMWNFMISCTKVITPFISWEVNRQDEVKFWEDSWNGHPPLREHQELQSTIPLLSHTWGTRLIDYVGSVEAPSGRVSWKEFSCMQISQDQKDLFASGIAK